MSADVMNITISDKQFARWVARHEGVRICGIDLVPEDNEHMTGTYALLDSRGRFFSNSTGSHVYGPSGFEVGWRAAWEPVAAAFDAEGFRSRGGAYEWSQGATEGATRWLDAQQPRA
jgi:radical S-adenosyl methionine domain-containing protein 2